MIAPERQLQILLQIFGGVAAIALFPMVMPWEWMEIVHERWLAMGPLQHQPVTEYLARSMSGLCGFYGCLMLLLARDVRRYSAVITYLLVATIVLGLIGGVFTCRAGMPLWWAVADSGSAVIWCGAMLMVQRRIRDPAKSEGSEIRVERPRS